MPRNTWNIFKQESNGSYTADGTIYRPNADVEDERISTHRKIGLADGDTAFVTPSTKYDEARLTFNWLYITDTDGIISKINTYIADGQTVKITTHLSDDYIGKFISLRKITLLGIEDYVDLVAIFERQV